MGERDGYIYFLAINNGAAVGWGSRAWPEMGTTLNFPNGVAIAAGNPIGIGCDTNGVLHSTEDDLAVYAPNTFRKIVGVASGTNQLIALQDNGTVYAWPTRTGSRVIVNVPPDLNDVVAIASGATFGLALKGDGTVVQWGSKSEVPPSATNVVKIVAGGDTAIAIRSDGTIVKWGGTVLLPSDLSGVIDAATAGDVIAIIQKPGEHNHVQLTTSTLRDNVTMHVRAGRKFALEFSSDGLYWYSVMPPFIATSDTETREIDASIILPFRRLRQVGAKVTPYIVSGVISGFYFEDGGAGYEDPPAVRFLDSAGVGATATAKVSNGVVVGITLQNPGQNYSRQTVVQIDPPPPVPTSLQFAPSAFRIVGTLFPGVSYKLRRSADLVNWTPVADPITATNRSALDITIDADSAAFFNLQELP
jgi:hypothetical protein